MNLRYLQLFIEVARAGSLSKAAVTLNKSQPMLSKQISDFEEELGAPLFHRTGRGVKLTEAGAKLLTRADTIMEEIRQAQREVRSLGKMQLTAATIALPPQMARLIATHLIREIVKDHPDIELHIKEGTSGPILDWLLARKVDVAVFYDTVSVPKTWAEVIHEEALHVVRRADLGPLPPTTNWTQLASMPLILPGKTEGFRALVDAGAAKAGVRLRAKLQADALSMIKQLVEAGFGYAILAPSAVRDEVRAGTIASSRLVQPEISRKLVIATSTDRLPSSGLHALVRIVKRISLDALEGAHGPGTAPGA